MCELIDQSKHVIESNKFLALELDNMKKTQDAKIDSLIVYLMNTISKQESPQEPLNEPLERFKEEPNGF